jgi:U3 small nucleolar RNA-associated protein 23
LQKKRKGPKGPNPLSIKKKKKLPEVPARSSQKNKAEPSDTPSSTAVSSGQKRKRDSQDEGQRVGITDAAQVVPESQVEDTPVSRKRKRRRKPIAIPPSSP